MNTWLADASKAINEGHLGLAWALYEHCLTVYPQKKKPWLAAIEFCKKSKKSLEDILERATAAKPDSELLWLVAAKESWQTIGDVEKASLTN